MLVKCRGCNNQFELSRNRHFCDTCRIERLRESKKKYLVRYRLYQKLRKHTLAKICNELGIQDIEQ